MDPGRRSELSTSPPVHLHTRRLARYAFVRTAGSIATTMYLSYGLQRHDSHETSAAPVTSLLHVLDLEGSGF